MPLRKYTLAQRLAMEKLLPADLTLESLLLAGEILVDGQKAFSKSQKVTAQSKIEIISKRPKYVSRGGFKLEQALREFNIEVQNKVCADFGACTGGFTDCLLQHGASKVYAIEKGLNQLDLKLQKDSRVVNIQGCSLFKLSRNIFNESIDLAVCDLSFIPLKKAIPKISELTDNAPLIALLKPHYEAQNLAYLRQGKVKEEFQQKIVEHFQNWLKNQNFLLKKFTVCHLPRQGRNLEYLCFISKI